MNFFDIFIGSNGARLASLLILQVLVALWIIARKMPKSRRTNAHVNLSVTISISIVFHLFNVLFLSNSNLINLSYTLSDILFWAILYGFYLLYNDRNLLHQGLFYSICLLTLIVSQLLGNMYISCVGSILFTFGAWFFLANNIPFGKKPKLLIGIFGLSKVLFLLDLLSNSSIQIFSFSSTVCFVISYSVLLSMNVDHLIQIMKGTYESSISDALTGLYNRRYFTKCVQQCVAKNLPASTIFIDLDNFKKLNDTQGHVRGDEILKKVAKILIEETEGIGVAGRYGGEEMVALIVDPSVEMDELTELIRSRIISEASFFTSDGEYQITASIGYSVYRDKWSFEEFIKMADQAMYAAKRTGKNKVIEYGSIDYNSLIEMEIENNIKQE